MTEETEPTTTIRSGTRTLCVPTDLATLAGWDHHVRGRESTRSSFTSSDHVVEQILAAEVLRGGADEDILRRVLDRLTDARVRVAELRREAAALEARGALDQLEAARLRKA